MREKIALTAQKTIDINQAKAKDYLSETLEQLSKKQNKLMAIRCVISFTIAQICFFITIKSMCYSYIPAFIILIIIANLIINRKKAGYDKKMKSLCCIEYMKTEMLIFRKRLVLKDGIVNDPLNKTFCENTEYEILKMFHENKSIEMLYVEDKFKRLMTEPQAHQH